MNEQHDIAQFVVRQGLLTSPEAEQALEQCQGVALLDWLQQRGWLTPHQANGLDELRRLAIASSAPHEQRTEDAPGRPVAVVGADTPRPGRDSTQSSDPLRALFGLPEDDRPRRGRFVLAEETPRGRGGMGQVWLAHDDGLGRRVALKEMRPDLAEQQEARRRFLLEAQVTSQLQHPGIVPVYEMLESEQGPFYTMRFVEGRTLAQAVADYHRQPTPSALHDLLGAFAQVCNTLAYAHSRGVVHRDLKPANVVLGSFGEVVVLDWGLALVLASRERERPESVPAVWVDDPVMSKAAGGTPGYMAPEQARGEIDGIDERADVFGLGAILCEILTGQPPFLGKYAEAMLQTSNADLAGGFSRLDDCGADGELIALAKHCLAAQPTERPRQAAEVAEAVTAYQRSVTEKLRQAEMGRAEAQVKAQEEHKRRKLTVGLATAVLALVLLGAGGGLFLQQTHAERMAEQARQETERQQAVLSALDKASELQQQARWPEARVVLEEAQKRLGEEEAHELKLRIEQALANLELVSRLDFIRQEANTLVEGRFDDAGAAPKYGEAFHESNLAAPGDGPEVVAQRIRRSGIRSVLVAALDDWSVRARDQTRRDWALEVARLADPDDWRNRFRDPKIWNNKAALERLAAQARVEELSPQLLYALAAALRRKGGDAVALLRRGQERHPADFWLSFELGTQMRTSKVEGSEAFLRAALALRPRTSVVHNNLGVVLADKGKIDEAIACFRKAIEIDFKYAKAHYNLGFALKGKGRVDEAIDSFGKAIDLDPKFVNGHVSLGVAQYGKGKVGEAIACYRKAITLDPSHAVAHNNLGLALVDKGKVEEAIACYRKAIDLDPKDADTRDNLGVALQDKGKVDEAIACHRKAIDLDPKNAAAHNNLGVALKRKGKVDEAIAYYRKAIDLDSKYAQAYSNLGNVLYGKDKVDEAIVCYRKALEVDPLFAQAHTGLGDALYRKRKVDEATVCYRKAIELDPKNVPAHTGLGNALVDKGKVDEAIICLGKAIVLDPKFANAHVGLGNALHAKRQVDEAIGCFRKAIALDPKNAMAHSNLGAGLYEKGNIDEAITSLRKAIDLDPKNAMAHTNHGLALFKKGRVEEAIACQRKAIDLEPRFAPAHGALGQALMQQGRLAESKTSLLRAINLLPQGHPLHAVFTRLLQHCQLFQALEKKLLDVLAGKAKPASVGEQLQLARLCLTTRRFVSGARLYAEAFKEDVKQAEDLSLAHRYSAACAAALAGCGKDHHVEKRDDKEKLRWRKQALGWLRADLAARQKQLKSGASGDAGKVRVALRFWQNDPNLAGLRDAEELKKLPTEERQACHRLWADVTALLKTVSD